MLSPLPPVVSATLVTLVPAATLVFAALTWPKFAASVLFVPAKTLIILAPLASKPLALTWPANVGASNNWTSTLPSVTTVFTLLLLEAAVAPPLMLSVLPSFCALVPELPATVMLRFTAVSKVLKALPTLLLVVVLPAPPFGLLVNV